jgi:hypothetical protein
MWEQRLIVVAGMALVGGGTMFLVGCETGGGQPQQEQARPASALMRDLDQDKPPDWRDEAEPPQFESPPPPE